MKNIMSDILTEEFFFLKSIGMHADKNPIEQTMLIENMLAKKYRLVAKKLQEVENV